MLARKHATTIPMQTGEGVMEKKIKFIKLFDEKVAGALSASGFSYTQEKVNGDKTVYCFEASSELEEAFRSLSRGLKYGEEIIAVEDGALLF